MKIVVRQLGPGMIQQMQSVCPDCKGESKELLCFVAALGYGFISFRDCDR